MLNLLLTAALAACPVYQVSISATSDDGDARRIAIEDRRDDRVLDFHAPVPPPKRTGVIEVTAPPTTYTDVKVRCYYAREDDVLFDGEAVVRVPRASSCRVKVLGQGLRTLRTRVVAASPGETQCLDVHRKGGSPGLIHAPVAALDVDADSESAGHGL